MESILDLLMKCSIWEKSWTHTIQSWMNKTINPTHPDYTDLVAYYPLNEGTGVAAGDDSPNAGTGLFDVAPGWRYEKRKQYRAFV